MERALAEANAADVFGAIRIHLHRGAGAYICGEETALMNSIEGSAATRASSRVPGGGRVVRPADDDQQRRDACRRAPHPSSAAPPGTKA